VKIDENLFYNIHSIITYSVYLVFAARWHITYVFVKTPVSTVTTHIHPKSTTRIFTLKLSLTTSPRLY